MDWNLFGDFAEKTSVSRKDVYLCSVKPKKRKDNTMSTAALQGLLEYLYGTLSPDNMLWVANHLIEQAKKEEDSELKPYTMEEINAMLDEAEANFAAGKGIPDEEAWDEWEEVFARMEQKHYELTEAV